MEAANGATAPGTALDVVEIAERSAMDDYLESTRRTASRIVDELTDLRDAERNLVNELTRQAGEARARQTSYERALTALGARTRRAPAAAPAAKPSGGRKDRTKEWQVSDAKVAVVERRLRELLPTSPHKAGNGVAAVTAGWVADNTDGLTPESAKKALAVLREREVVRVAGTSRGGGVLFALMPRDANDD